MKLKTLLKLIPDGAVVETEFIGSSWLKSECYAKGTNYSTMLPWYDVKTIQAVDNKIKIVAIKPKGE